MFVILMVTGSLYDDVTLIVNCDLAGFGAMISASLAADTLATLVVAALILIA